MKPGEIWGYKDPESGKKTGWAIYAYFPPVGQALNHVAWARRIKDPNNGTFVFILTPDGVPMLKTGGGSPNWKLIEEAPRGTDKR